MQETHALNIVQYFLVNFMDSLKNHNHCIKPHTEFDQKKKKEQHGFDLYAIL